MTKALAGAGRRDQSPGFVGVCGNPMGVHSSVSRLLKRRGWLKGNSFGGPCLGPLNRFPNWLLAETGRGRKFETARIARRVRRKRMARGGDEE